MPVAKTVAEPVLEVVARAATRVDLDDISRASGIDLARRWRRERQAGERTDDRTGKRRTDQNLLHGFPPKQSTVMVRR